MKEEVKIVAYGDDGKPSIIHWRGRAYVHGGTVDRMLAGDGEHLSRIVAQAATFQHAGKTPVE